MKKNLLTSPGSPLLWLVCPFLVSFFGWGTAFSQSFALQTESVKVQQEAVIPLEKALSNLEARYQVVFGYESHLVENHLVKAGQWKQQKLENALTALLVPIHLTYEQVEKNVYVIKKAGPARLNWQPSGGETEEKQAQPLSPAYAEALARNIPVSLEKTARLTVTGTVKGETGEGIPGVSVVLKGTSTGTATNAEGNYSLVVPDGAGTLVFSYIGYTTEEVPIGNRTTIDVSLVPDIKSLTEVVVVGYGTQEKRDVTGSISSIKADEIQNIPIPSVEGLIQGRAAGVQVSPNSGVPGAGISVRIRGAASISGGNEPLYVVDGVPLKGGDYGASVGQSRNEFNPMSDINPNDIESIEILKDASSAAIYGARAANGVVLITTKRGKANKTAVTLNYSTGFQVRPFKYDLLSSAEFIEFYNEAHANVGVTPAVNLSAFGYDTVNTDWQDALFRNAPISSYDISASGGNEKSRFALSLGYFDQDGIIINTGYKRLSGRLNLDHDISSKVRIGASLSYSQSTTSRIQGDDTGVAVFMRTVVQPSVVPIYNPNGSYHFPTINLININPYSVAKELQNTAKNNRGIGNLYAEFDILKGLKLRLSAGGDLLFLNESLFNNSRVYLLISRPLPGFRRHTGPLQYAVKQLASCYVAIVGGRDRLDVEQRVG